MSHVYVDQSTTLGLSVEGGNIVSLSMSVISKSIRPTDYSPADECHLGYGLSGWQRTRHFSGFGYGRY